MDQIYEISGIEVTSEVAPLGITIPDNISPSGYFIVGDGVITDAWLTTDFGEARGEQAAASFKLTQPTVLRPIIDDDSTVTAVGTLTYGGVERPDTEVQISVVSLDDAGAELNVIVNSPAGLLEIGGDSASVTARLVFEAMTLDTPVRQDG
ncbi:hypothetical protein JOF28_002620 [Leucobacter exalbidus]|uniref:Uncharacterized protein n=1 Tax=Leucobacter exalbidus TaxID=662960 RepID=A0A940PV40_9MICO|nr:hypothetical protein [Leucobacter exalbidus]MBP1327388.1 hypothetical protein [Leucobacter exalbidus]